MSSSTDRVRRWRRREASGMIAARAEIPQSLGITLIQLGLLSEQDSLNVYRCGDALLRYIEAMRKKM